VTAKQKSLFNPVVSKHPHVAFQAVRGSEHHAAARQLMDELFQRMGDVDGNFIDDFQGPGFHSRLFELASYAYLEEIGGVIERSQRSPDFVVARGSTRVAVESVTVNPVKGRNSDISIQRLVDPRTEDIQAKVNDEFPIRLRDTLARKLEHRYWDKPACRGVPFVLLVGPFHEPGCTTYVDESVARYLYGTESYSDWVVRNGLLVREAPVENHSFMSRTIPSNFFATEATEGVSAIVWCNQFTVPRFFRIAAQAAGLPADVDGVVEGERATGDARCFEPFSYRLGECPAGAERWSRGVTVFVNPSARIKLPEEFFPCTSSFQVRDGRLIRDVNGFHPLTSRMFVYVGAKNTPLLGEVERSEHLPLTDEELLERVRMSSGSVSICGWQTKQGRIEIGLRDEETGAVMALSTHYDEIAAKLAGAELEVRMDRLVAQGRFSVHSLFENED
jgi:hypothetical protein